VENEFIDFSNQKETSNTNCEKYLTSSFGLTIKYNITFLIILNNLSEDEQSKQID
jgi:hypothetical protein